jgi:serine/threonine-protein kinase
MVGQTILHYQILQKLGAGGMGEIYKAQDSKLNRMVAIKVLTGVNSSDPDSRRRFVQEAQAASSLNHPNIITIHDIISHGDDQIMVMEFVNGKTLGEVIPPHGLSVAETLQYAVQIADGLHAAHSAGITHRDLKPGNIMVTPQGRVKILDFGLAKLAAPAGPVSLSDITQTVGPAPMTVQGSIVGTVSYMSPEQAQGTKVDSRSDIFSFGCVLYEMLTGRKAFTGESNLMILTAILRDEPAPIAGIAQGVPPELIKIVHRALRKDPVQRWQSMQDMHVELLMLKQKSDSGVLFVPQLPTVELLTPARPQSRSWGGTAVLAIAVFVLVCAGLWWWGSHSVAKNAPRVTPTAKVPNPDAPPKPSALSPAVLNNQAILDLVQANVPPAVIITHIRSSPTNFTLTTAEIIRLAKAGATEAVIQAMRDPKGVAANPANAGVAGSPGSANTAPQNRAVTVVGGSPLEMTLTADVPADCKPGQLLQFQVSKDVAIGSTVVVAKGAVVTGVVVDAAKKKFLVHNTRPTFRLVDVVAVDGSKLKVRATSGRLGESRKDPQFEPIGGVRSKDAPVPAGSRFLAWFDGDQTVTLK